MSVPICVVDAFTAEPFRGNAAAVCFPRSVAESRWMQAVAAEMNLSETAFVVPEGEAWNLRWFTPAVEVDLCGHATLAAAHALWETGRLPADQPARFRTLRSGELVCRKTADGILMDFPSRPASAAEAPEALIAGLGMQPVWSGRSVDDWCCELPDDATVRSLKPAFHHLAQLPGRGIIVTARSADPAYDFVSRFFAPACGIDEDPVTGSAHCTLAPFWSGRLGRDALRGWQASRRGGAVGTRCHGERIELTGSAVTVWEGTLR